MSINVIIVAVLALLVLVVLIFATQGKLRSFIRGTESCDQDKCFHVDTPGQCGPQEAAVPMRCLRDQPGEQAYCCTSLSDEE